MYSRARAMINSPLTGAESNDFCITPFFFNIFQVCSHMSTEQPILPLLIQILKIKVLSRIRSQIRMISKFEFIVSSVPLWPFYSRGRAWRPHKDCLGYAFRVFVAILLLPRPGPQLTSTELIELRISLLLSRRWAAFFLVWTSSRWWGLALHCRGETIQYHLVRAAEKAKIVTNVHNIFTPILQW